MQVKEDYEDRDAKRRWFPTVLDLAILALMAIATVLVCFFALLAYAFFAGMFRD
jgi:hypothetical protein